MSEFPFGIISLIELILLTDPIYHSRIALESFYQAITTL
jgi:hypothetical protein